MEPVSIKNHDNGTTTITGYTVVFGGVDLHGETFERDTKFYLENYQNVPLFYDHKQGRIRTKIGNVKSITADEVGLFVEAELDKAADYATAIEKLVGAGVVGMSSGTLPHISERKNTTITEWPLGEVSLTVIPAEHRTVGHVQTIKSLAEDETLKALLSEVAEIATEQDATVGTSPDITILNDYSNGDNTMTEPDNTKAINDRLLTLEDNMTKASDQLGRVISIMENSPALKQQRHIAPDSETDHADVKSFGDWLIALKNGNYNRLQKVYGSTKDMLEGGGTSGGYLVPDEFHAQLFAVQSMQPRLSNLVTRMPVGSVSGAIPSLDNYTAVTANAGNTPYSGGITSAATSEAATFTETQPLFKQVRYLLSKVGGVIEVSNEMISDSAVAVESLLTQLIAIAQAEKMEYYILRGSGNQEPLGIFNCAATIGVTTATNNTFTWVDALAMKDRFKRVAGAPIWVTAPGMWNQIGQFETTGGGGVWVANQAGGLPTTLMGYPIMESEHMPVATTDDVLLLDPKSYVLFEKGNLAIDFSEHAGFNKDMGTWRFKQRCDGRMWLNSAITPSNGGSTLSPAVYHND